MSEAAYDWRSILEGRPHWMNALMLFCAFMAVIYVPWDLFFKPIAEDQEVWFGLMLTGWGAKLTEPIHLAIYAAGAWGFYRMRPYMWPWATVYVAQISFGMLVWAVLELGGIRGWVGGIVFATPFAALAVALHRARDLFRPAG